MKTLVSEATGIPEENLHGFNRITPREIGTEWGNNQHNAQLIRSGGLLGSESQNHATRGRGVLTYGDAQHQHALTIWGRPRQSISAITA